MAYIAPDGYIDIYGDVGLSPDQEDTLYFASTIQKNNYFNNITPLKSLTSQSYTRKERGVIRIEAQMIEVYDAHYMRYANVSFEDKWFYAFVKRVNYINNITVEIEFEIDVMMTWMGAFTLGQCFIERQHTTVDYPGSNIVDEHLETGDYMTERVIKTGFTGVGDDDMLRHCAVCIAATVDASGSSADGGAYAGIYSGCHYHYFDTVNQANTFINTLVSAGKSDAIVTIALVPKNYVPTINDTAMHSWGSNVQNKPYSSINGWTGFKNKKLLTYPYKSLLVTNMEGEFSEYRYEFFDGNTYGFRCNGVSTVNAEFIITPIDYKSQPWDITDNMIMSSFPIVSWNVDTWKAWYAQNKSSWWTSLFSSASNTGLYAGMGAANITGNAIMSGGLDMQAMQSGAGGVMTAKHSMDRAWAQLAQTRDYQRKPPTFGGKIGGDIMLSIGCKDFYYIEKSITREYAKMIDDYFTMYGYAIKEVGTPNMNARPYYTYVKTSDCLIHGFPRSIPADDVAAIQEQFNSGVRFWKNHTQIGDYTLNNAPT